MAKNDKTPSFKDTLNLPRTDFPIRPNAKEDDPALVARWEEDKLYEKAFYAHEGNEKYVLLDGPPYANGHVHLGGAYNNLLKDIVTKGRRMMGMQVPVTPGWDCHGLPIELKVVKENPHAQFSKEELIQECRSYAQYWIDTQRKELKRLGIVMNWNHPYITMDFSFESKELEALGIFVERGYINKSNKTVPWCPSCQTVLASAEIEYQDRKDPSTYVLFPLSEQAHSTLFPDHPGKEAGLAIWTTSPWTIPLSRAVMAKTDASYVALDLNGGLVIIGEKLADALCQQMQQEKVIVKTFGAHELEHLKVVNPLVEKVQVPIIVEPSVLDDEGTAFVNCAPGAGPIDYEVGIKNNLEIYSPVAPDGTYTKQIQPDELVGMLHSDGQIWAMRTLKERNRLLHKTSMRHAYPHCWRCRGGLIFRATKQWFFNLTHKDLRTRTLQAIDQSITMLPASSKNRFKATIESRLEWCLSRQRTWGVPIPALICTACEETYISKSFIDTVAQGVAKEGIEYWSRVSISELVGEGFACAACNGTSFTKEEDILDVWVDSGLIHYVVLDGNKDLAFPADLVLEGKDQHRGWFQSSLLTSMALEEEPHTKAILTHGFTVDEKGIKMSKSLGNVVAPQEVIDKLGTDGLRLWVSSVDYAGEAIISDTILANVQQSFRKIRNTCRFLLSNLYDFEYAKDALPLDKLRVIDRYALEELYTLNEDMISAYKGYEFTELYQKLSYYCSVNLSTFYFEIVKDILYVEKADSHARRSVQTACWHILDTLTKLMAPILSFTAEQVSDLYQTDKKESIHLQTFNDLAQIKSLPKHTEYAQQWDRLKEIRSAILKATEGLREKGEIKRSLDAGVALYLDPQSESGLLLKDFFSDLSAHNEDAQQFFKECAIVSQCEIASSSDGLSETAVPGLYLKAYKARGEKCPRCWQWAESVNEQGLDQRCADAVAQ